MGRKNPGSKVAPRLFVIVYAMIPIPTECAHFRDALLDDQHGRLASERARELHAHLRECASCAEVDREGRWLLEVLRTWLPSPRAPAAFRDRLLEELRAAGSPLGAALRGWREHAAIGAVLIAAVLVAAFALYGVFRWRQLSAAEYQKTLQYSGTPAGIAMPHGDGFTPHGCSFMNFHAAV
jgi:hypothetical protein